MRTVTAYEVYKALDHNQGKTYGQIQRDAFTASGLDASNLQPKGFLDDIIKAAYLILHGGATRSGDFYPLMLELERMGLVKSEFAQPDQEGNPRRRMYWIAHPNHLSEQGFNLRLGFGE